MRMEHSRKAFIPRAVIFASIAILVSISAGFALIHQVSSDIHEHPNLSSVEIGNLTISVEVADTPNALRSGLSGRIRLPTKQGMLFAFPVPDIYAFWMPDMNFPIDLLWIDSAGKIVGTEESMMPETDLKHPHYYKPPVPIQYVIEVNAGFIKKHGIKTGQTVALPPGFPVETSYTAR